MEKEWVRIENNLVNEPREENIHGINITMMMPSFDVPTMARSYEDEVKGALVIDFGYSDFDILDEDENRETVDTEENFIKLVVGKKSKRLFSIIIKKSIFDSHPACQTDEECALNLTVSTIGDYTSRHKVSRPQNFLAAKNILKSYGRQLISERAC